MKLKAIVEQHSGPLSPADERLIKEILSNPAEAAVLTAADLAARVGVHESTAVRLSQKLGYRGYRELRAELQTELINHTSPAERLRRRLARTHELATLVTDEIAALQELLDSVSQEQLNDAAQTLIAARRIFLFAQGHATSLVEFMDRRLRRLGFDTIDLRHRGRDLAEHLITLNSDDTLLAFAFHVRPPGLELLLGQAAAVSTPSILISDTLGPLVRPQPDILLWARRGEKGEFHSLVVPMAICDALVLTIASLDVNRSTERLDQLAGLIQRYEQGK
jgi:DNA-binding MurR/RpiR family transcriptional regulator